MTQASIIYKLWRLHALSAGENESEADAGGVLYSGGVAPSAEPGWSLVKYQFLGSE